MWFQILGKLGRHRFVMLTPPPEAKLPSYGAAPVATLVLRAPGECALQELKAAVDSALSMLSAIASTPVALPGGGYVAP